MMLRWTAQLVQLCKCSSKTNMGQSVSLLKSSRLFPSRQLRSCRLGFVDSRRTLSSPSRKTSQKVTNTALPHKKAAATNATSNTATIGEAPFPLRLFYTYRSKPVSLCQPAKPSPDTDAAVCLWWLILANLLVFGRWNAVPLETENATKTTEYYRALHWRQIALSRSQAVRDAVREMSETADFSRIDLQVDAFGEAMPLACDDSVWGRKANRRVEVWVR